MIHGHDHDHSPDCPGCKVFFKTLLNTEERKKFLVTYGGEKAASNLVNCKADAMRKKNPKGEKSFSSSIAKVFNKYLAAMGVKKGLKEIGIDESKKADRKTIDGAVLDYVAASKGKHW